jgi:hypothetical protein
MSLKSGGKAAEKGTELQHGLGATPSLDSSRQL